MPGSGLECAWTGEAEICGHSSERERQGALPGPLEDRKLLPLWHGVS